MNGFETQASASNVTAIRGETAMLVCKVINIGDKAVSEFYQLHHNDGDGDDPTTCCKKNTNQLQPTKAIKISPRFVAEL